MSCKKHEYEVIDKIYKTKKDNFTAHKYEAIIQEIQAITYVMLCKKCGQISTNTVNL